MKVVTLLVVSKGAKLRNMKRRTANKVELPLEATSPAIATADTHPSKQYEEKVAFAAKTKNGVILQLVHYKSLVWAPVPLILLLIFAVQSIMLSLSRSAYSSPAFGGNVIANYEISNQSSLSNMKEANNKSRAILDMEVPFIHIGECLRDLFFVGIWEWCLSCNSKEVSTFLECCIRCHPWRLCICGGYEP